MSKSKGLLILLVIVLLSLASGMPALGDGDISDFTYEFDESDLYTQEEIEAAAAVVVEHFREWYHECKLLCVRFDKEGSEEDYEFNREHYPDNPSDFIRMEIDLYVGPKADNGFEPDGIHKSWLFMMIRDDAEGEWQIQNYGYY